MPRRRLIRRRPGRMPRRSCEAGRRAGCKSRDKSRKGTQAPSGIRDEAGLYAQTDSNRKEYAQTDSNRKEQRGDTHAAAVEATSRESMMADRGIRCWAAARSGKRLTDAVLARQKPWEASTAF
eukprot:362411-Chlamydomonas_euryale.AAC.2